MLWLHPRGVVTLRGTPGGGNVGGGGWFLRGPVWGWHRLLVGGPDACDTPPSPPLWISPQYGSRPDVSPQYGSVVEGALGVSPQRGPPYGLVSPQYGPPGGASLSLGPPGVSQSSRGPPYVHGCHPNMGAPQKRGLLFGTSRCVTLISFPRGPMLPRCGSPPVRVCVTLVWTPQVCHPKYVPPGLCR